MARLDEVTVKPYGNVLEITIRIPWERLTENHWTRYFTNKEKLDRSLIEGQRQVKIMEILKNYEASGSISTAAKESQVTYYYASCVIREASVAARKAEKEAIRTKVSKLAASGVSLRQLAKQFGKSYETIRRWTKTQTTA